MPRREYTGGAKRTALVGDITATSTNITVSDATGYPTGATAPFVVAIDTGVAAEEKVLIASRSGNTLTVSQRGFDDTTAAPHGAGSSVDHVLTATDVREANAHVNDTTGDPHPQYLNPTRASAAYVAKAGGDTITASAATVIPLVVKGAASQTANLLEARNSAGTVLAYVGPQGLVVAGGGAGVFPETAATVGLYVQGRASQTANLLEARNSAGTVIASVGAVGQVLVTDRASSGLFRELQFGALDSAGAGFRTVRVAN